MNEPTNDITTIPDITRTTRLNMREKLAWAERSFGRMTDAIDGDHDSVQDHFWSFLHGVHLLWFYLGRWVKESGGGSSTKRLIEEWKRESLSPDESVAWESLRCLRDQDAHVEPVVPKKPEGGRLLYDPTSGKILYSARTGKLLLSKRKPFRITQDGTELELLSVCEAGLAASQKLVRDFDDGVFVCGGAKR